MSNQVLDQEASSSAAEGGRGTMANFDHEEKDSLHFEAAPDGGLVAWLVAAGAAFVFFCGLGFANSFGIFQQYYMSHQLQGQSEDKVAWIGSLSAFLQFAAGAVAGPLFDRYGSWVRSSRIMVVDLY
jgi:hypothetical protein